MENKTYAVIASFKNCMRNNVEIVDYNLTLEQAENLKSQILELSDIDEDWELETSVKDEKCIFVANLDKQIKLKWKED